MGEEGFDRRHWGRGDRAGGEGDGWILRTRHIETGDRVAGRRVRNRRRDTGPGVVFQNGPESQEEHEAKGRLDEARNGEGAYADDGSLRMHK